MNNSPIRFNDPNGDAGSSCCDDNDGFSFTWHRASLHLHQDWDHIKSFFYDALVSGGSTVNGQLHTFSGNTWPTNPAQTIFNIQSDVNPYASLMGQYGGLPAPIGPGGAGPALNFLPAVSEAMTVSTSAANTFALHLPTIVFAGAATARKAKEGADLAGIKQNTTRIPAPSGKKGL